MKKIFINLKRFDVPRDKGGVCPKENPEDWIEEVMKQTVDLGIGLYKNMDIVYFVPEALIVPAQKALSRYSERKKGRVEIGCQGVFRDNIEPDKNFGAFTTNMPAASAYQMGCRWSIIGHSEERRDKQEVIGAFEPDWNKSESLRAKCSKAVDGLINLEVMSALNQGMDVLLCIGETAEERGNGDFAEQQKRVKDVLTRQLERGLTGADTLVCNRKVVIGYEPIWAIGPGKTPPDGKYIAFVSSLIKECVKQLYHIEISVVYGGGLKEENAAMISGVETIDGGLVALTRFNGEIGFYVEDLKNIIEKYCIN